MSALCGLRGRSRDSDRPLPVQQRWFARTRCDPRPENHALFGSRGLLRVQPRTRLKRMMIESCLSS